MEDNESNNESKALSAAQLESESADRRTFMKAAVKTAVAGAVVAGIAASAGKAEAATAITGTCGGAVVVPKAVVKARVMFNNRLAITRQNVIDVLGGIFDGCACPACGLGGVPGNTNPGTVTEIELAMAYLDGSQVSAVIFTDANTGGC